MITILDYGVGNLRSVQKAFTTLGYASQIVTSASSLDTVTGLVLPGVGAFGDAMASLRRQEFLQPLRDFAESGRPLLGICLGMQLLFSVSEEHGEHEGLGLVPGAVRRMRGDYKIPHVGWNQLTIEQSHPLLAGIQTGDFAYFVHSYFVEPLAPQAVLATTDYHQSVPAAIAMGNVMGLQFHPEKSSQTGLRILANFAALCEKGSVGT